MISTRPPKNYPEGRDFERWMYNIWKKLGDSDISLDDLDMRSINPVLGMIQDLNRKVESLARDTRNIRAEIELLKHASVDNRSHEKILANILTRLKNIEGDL